MTRDEFMVKARETARSILSGKENGIMNLVQQAWAEGKRNAEVDTLKEAVWAAFNGSMTIDRSCEIGYVDPKDLTYPTWGEWLLEMGILEKHDLYANDVVYTTMLSVNSKVNERIPGEIAQALKIPPMEG